MIIVTEFREITSAYAIWHFKLKAATRKTLFLRPENSKEMIKGLMRTIRLDLGILVIIGQRLSDYV